MIRSKIEAYIHIAVYTAICKSFKIEKEKLSGVVKMKSTFVA